jgi:hypothetical protein
MEVLIALRAKGYRKASIGCQSKRSKTARSGPLNGESIMKRIIALTAAAAVVAMAGQAAADPSAQGSVNLSATAADTCAIRGITAGTSSGATQTGSGVSGTTDTVGGVANLPSNAAIGYTGLFNTTTAETNSLVNTLNVSAFCNYAGHQVRLRSANGGLTNTSAVAESGSFARRVNYSAALESWGTATTTTLSTGAVNQLNSTKAETTTPGNAGVTPVNTSAAVLRVTTSAFTGAPALAGSFTDTLTVRLGAAF